MVSMKECATGIPHLCSQVPSIWGCFFEHTLNIGCGDSAVVMCIASGVHDIASNYPCIWHECTVCCCQSLKLSAPSLNVAVTVNSLHVKLITMRCIELVTGQTGYTSDMVQEKSSTLDQERGGGAGGGRGYLPLITPPPTSHTLHCTFLCQRSSQSLHPSFPHRELSFCAAWW